MNCLNQITEKKSTTMQILQNINVMLHISWAYAGNKHVTTKQIYFQDAIKLNEIIIVLPKF